MNCNTVSKKLSAYMDSELTPGENATLEEHLDKCPGCREQLSALTEQHNLLKKQSIFIRISPRFRAEFWAKARTYDTQEQRPFLPVFKWTPVPIGISFLLVIFSLFSLVSPAIYGASISEIAKSTLAGYTKDGLFGPANFSKFCDRCANRLCECCKDKPGAQCNCKERK